MAALSSVEKTLGDVFKNAPKLPENAKKSLVNAWPWIALVFGVLQLVAAWGLWGLTRLTNSLVDYANQASLYATGKTVGLNSTDKMVIYLGILMLALDAVILLMAFGPLKARAKHGWDLLFLGSVLNVVYSVVSIFIDGRGFGSFIFSLIGSAVGFYLLFQVKDMYKGSSTTTTPAA